MARITLAIVCLGLMATNLLTADAADARRPNVLIIVGDDMGYADVGFHGCKDIPTPHLDALAASGVRFTNGYVSGPYCSPTRAGLLSGQYQTRFGHEFNPSSANGMPTSVVTIADRLKAAGYTTGIVGKWHLGGEPQFHPQKRGFDEFFGFLPGGHDYFDDKGIVRGNEPVQEKEYLTDAFGREASAFVERHKAKPWFLYLAFNAVHTPMQADDARLQKFAAITDKTRRTYAAMMFAMDEAIGRVRKAVADAGLERDTLVTFISDNGGPTMPGVTINGSINTPLRGSKRTTLEGGVRVPFLVSWPAQLKPAVENRPAIQLDLQATALAAAGVPMAADWKLDGVDLLPYLNGQNTAAPHEALYWRFGPQMAIRMGDYKLVKYDTTADQREASDKVLRNVSTAKLYNLADDLGETKDLAAAMPDKVKELQAQWDAWNATLEKPLWGGGPAAGEGKKGAQRAAKKK